MNKNVRSPVGGYDFEEKSFYRHAVHDYIFNNIKKPSDTKILILPSREGLELPLLVKYGYKQKNIYCVDDNPAIIASSHWRKNYPDVKFYGLKLIDAIRRMNLSGITLNAINMDLCSNLNINTLNDFNESIFHLMGNGRIVVALTMLDGRESAAVNTLAELYLNNRSKYLWNDYPKRISVVFQNCVDSISNVAIKLGCHGRYKSGRQTIVWGTAIFYLREYLRLQATQHFNIVKNIYKKLKSDIDFFDREIKHIINPYRLENRSKSKKWCIKKRKLGDEYIDRISNRRKIVEDHIRSFNYCGLISNYRTDFGSLIENSLSIELNKYLNQYTFGRWDRDIM